MTDMELKQLTSPMTEKERETLLPFLPILTQMRDIHDVLIDVSTELKGVCVMAQEHHKDLNGNGKPGLKADMATTKTIQENCPAREGSKPGNVLAALAIAVALLSVAVSVWLAIEL